jgi:serine/threonine protein kinase
MLADPPRQLVDGWVVVERLPRLPGRSRSVFSEAYLAERPDGTQAFVKAFDYIDALDSDDPNRRLEELTRAYNFESEILDRCGAASLNRVVRSIGGGQIIVDGFGRLGRVSYLLFEYAEAGDLRKVIDSGAADDVFSMRALHDTAAGLAQLHRLRIAHQDIKPANVLSYPGQARISDLGSSCIADGVSPNDDYDICGDDQYAAPEHLYGHLSPDWATRRLACDLYHLGSLIAVLFAGIGTTPALAMEVPASHHWSTWNGPYEDALDIVRDAFDRVATTVTEQLPSRIRTELGSAYRHLCEPDPRRRGHPRNRIGASMPYDLGRYTTLFNLLKVRLETRR